MSIRGMEGMTNEQIEFELKMGGKFVVFQYCISILIMTFRRSSSVIFIKNGQNTILAGLPYTLLSLVFGWWGFPWGPIYTIGSFMTNFSGGKDITKDILKSIGRDDVVRA